MEELKNIQEARRYKAVDSLFKHKYEWEGKKLNYFEANHSAKFYAWLDKLQPDWRERKQLLNEWALRLP